MDQLIPLINKLQDVFNVIGYDPLDLPQIVVVGSQSSGKSSVLENIVNKDFLPRGKDIVTRRPLVLQLIHENTDTEWGEFLHLPKKKFEDFSAIRDEIEKDTERIAGANKGVSKIPIHLRIHSHRVLNLTLVDLPGITKIPIGDQPADIEHQVKQLVLDYITKPNSIILAVTPANIDLVNSEALKISRECDPEGRRTIGVLTKIDLMDAGTNALEILLNKSSYKLKHGFIGVVNRSQHDINTSKPIDDAIKAEAEYFRTHPVYRTIAGQCGVSYLSKTLNQENDHIKESLPELKAKINSLIINAQNELQNYGEFYLQKNCHKGSLLLGLLTKFSTDFSDSIEGNAKNWSISELCGGARINNIFNEVFPSSLNQIEETSSLNLTDVRTAIRNSSGPRPSLFVPEVSFDLLVKKQISKLKGPSLRCLELVYDEVLNIIAKCDKKDLARFPVLNQKVSEAAAELAKERLECTSQMISDLIQIELAYINTNHPDFIRAGAAISALGKIFEKKRKRDQAIKPSSAGATPPEEISTPSYFQPYARSDGGLLNYLFKGAAASYPREKKISSAFKQLSLKKVESPEDLLENSLNNLDLTDDSKMVAEEPEFLSEKEEMETHLILSLIQSYYAVVRKNLQDSVPKAIMHFLVNNVRENMQNRLVSDLYREDLFAALLKEDESIAREREKLIQSLDVYRKAAAILSELRDINFK